MSCACHLQPARPRRRCIRWTTLAADDPRRRRRTHWRSQPAVRSGACAKWGMCCIDALSLWSGAGRVPSGACAALTLSACGQERGVCQVGHTPSSVRVCRPGCAPKQCQPVERICRTCQ
eukprot:359734-Chlamydomonas_euryale.AAC.3